jgi:hypothetical protein
MTNQRRFSIATDTGETAELAASSTPIGESLRWTETDMEYALGLCPAVLSVEGELSIGLDGGKTERMSDQLYVDELGRATIVEIKKRRALLDDLAQLLGYAEHERQLPWGETERRYQCTQLGWPRPWRTRALEQLSAMLRGEATVQEASTIPQFEAGLGELREEVGRRWGPTGMALHGLAPPRMILVAPDFEPACVQFVQRLQERRMNVRLIRAALLRAPDGHLVLDSTDVGSTPKVEEMELVWEATHYLWTDGFISTHFEPNGWAEHRSDCLVSFSARWNGRVRFFLSPELEAEQPQICLRVWPPEKWVASERRELLCKFEQLAPAGLRANGEVQWLFSLPHEREQFVAAARSIATTMHEVFGSRGNTDAAGEA